jgi:ribosomal protein L18
MKKKIKIYKPETANLGYRLSIYRSCKNIYLQLINDEIKKTYIGLSSILLSAERKKKFLFFRNLKSSFLIGFFFSYICEKKKNLKKIQKITLNKSFIGRVKYLLQGFRVNNLLS